MAQNTNIKATIGTFCQILRLTGAIKINPEVFRQAKFNKEEATRPLWRLNYEILALFSNHKRPPGNLSDCDVVISVKSAFFYLDYKCKEFYNLPISMSTGSRELLIALGWIIAKYDLVLQLLNFMETPIFDLFADAHISSVGVNNSLLMPNLMEDMDTILHMQRKNKHEMKIIRQMFKFLTKMIRKLETERKQQDLCSIKKTSALNLVISMCHKKKMNELISLLEQEKALIKYYIKWFQTENLFWKWLSSVVEEKRKHGFSKMEYTEKPALDLILQNIVLCPQYNTCGTVELLQQKLEGFCVSNAGHNEGEDIDKEFLWYEMQEGYRNIILILQKLLSNIFGFTPTTLEINPALSWQSRSKVKEKTSQGSLYVSVEMLKGDVESIRNKLEQSRSLAKEAFKLLAEKILNDVIHLPMPKR